MSQSVSQPGPVGKAWNLFVSLATDYLVGNGCVVNFLSTVPAVV